MTTPTPAPGNSVKRLGRGLSSLISSAPAYEPDAGPVSAVDPDHPAAPSSPRASRQLDIAIDDIAPNPLQPRRVFNDDELRDLADSIAKQGIIQPLAVTAAGNNVQSDKPYVLIAGERRLRAARLAGLKVVPCLLMRGVRRQEMLEWALIENIQRADLNPIERAAAYREYVDRFNITQEEAATRLGQGRATVANYLRLLDLSPEAQAAVANGELSAGHAKLLAGHTADHAWQNELTQQIIREGLSVRQLEQLLDDEDDAAEDASMAAVAAARAAAAGQPADRAAAQKPLKPAYVRDMEEKLTQAVGNKVTISLGRQKNRGRVQIHFYSLDDFDRIAERLGMADTPQQQ
jgi:ParB family chromosome partitioning protein